MPHFYILSYLVRKTEKKTGPLRAEIRISKVNENYRIKPHNDPSNK